MTLMNQIAALDKRIAEIDPDAEPGLYHELVFYRNELEAERETVWHHSTTKANTHTGTTQVLMDNQYSGEWGPKGAAGPWFKS